MSTNSTCALPEFQPFAKIPRLSREIIVTEKIDGSNAQIFIQEDGTFLAGSRNRWLTPESDNFGFCKWALENKEELLKLGPGRHFGEWYGNGIQRGYGLKEKRFALFNVRRWETAGEILPACCSVVPVLYRGIFSEDTINTAIYKLEKFGSAAVPGFLRPEGIIIYHVAGGYLFKKTIEGDGQPKTFRDTKLMTAQLSAGVEAAQAAFKYRHAGGSNE